MTGAMPMTAGAEGGGAPGAAAPAAAAPKKAGVWGRVRGWWKLFPRWWELGICLLVLTGIGAFFRFWRLDFQAYWTDEAYTLPRISRTFDYMLQQLTNPPQGFPPGWYAMLRWWRMWWESKGVAAAEVYDPNYMRILPAIFGTLTVPAMYFLARQFTDRRGALLVMLLAAVNPFLIYYSRDIKMYAALWFFVVLNSAIFFQWQTTHRHLIWFPLYVVTGVLMTSLHAMAWAIVALHLIFLLTRPRPRPWDGPLWVVAAGAMAWLPLYWFTVYLKLPQSMARIEDPNNGGLIWIPDYTDMSWRTIASLPTSNVLGYLWPVYPVDDRIERWFWLERDFNQHLATRSWEWMARWELYAAYALFAIMILGLIPWRGRRARGEKNRAERQNSSTRGRWWWVFLWVALPTAALAATWIPPESVWYERIWGDRSQNPLWEPRYLGIVLPALLLWLGAALRRLPLWPVRLVAIGFMVFVCGFSALSNHLIYRNPPYHRVAQVVAKYAENVRDSEVAVCAPTVHYQNPAQDANIAWVFKLLPLEARGSRGYYTWSNVESATLDNRTTEQQVASWLRREGQIRGLKTIVLADRYGDERKPEDMLSDESAAKMLGPAWKLVYTEYDEWHYEWRFYIFHTWRTRVWQRE